VNVFGTDHEDLDVCRLVLLRTADSVGLATAVYRILQTSNTLIVSDDGCYSMIRQDLQASSSRRKGWRRGWKGETYPRWRSGVLHNDQACNKTPITAMNTAAPRVIPEKKCKPLRSCATAEQTRKIVTAKHAIVKRICMLKLNNRNEGALRV